MTLPTYNQVDLHPSPPAYTPAVHHLSLVYYASESFHNKDKNPDYIPLLLEINSTQLNFYHVQPKYAKHVSHLFNVLHSDLVDPNLNLKAKSSFTSSTLTSLSSLTSSTLSNTFVGPGKGFSLNSFSSSPNPFSFSLDSSSLISLRPQRKSPKQKSNSNSFFKLFRSNSNSQSFQPTSSYHFKNICLQDQELQSSEFKRINKIITHEPNIMRILDTVTSENDIQLESLKSTLFKSFSLQELIKFGNAIDSISKPFTLRLIFPNEQFVIVSYTAPVYASIFYKLNIGRELSFDLDLRVPLPLDYSVPRRNRGRRHRRRSSVSTVSTTTSTASRGRTRSGSLINQNDVDDDDELDVSFNIELAGSRTACQPNIILEESEIIESVEMNQEQEQVSTITTNSTTSRSEDANLEQVSTITTASRSTSFSTSLFSNADIPSIIPSIVPSIFNSDIPLETEKEPIVDNERDSYKELIFAIKCIRSCKNKTLPWLS